MEDLLFLCFWLHCANWKCNQCISNTLLVRLQSLLACHGTQTSYSEWQQGDSFPRMRLCSTEAPFASDFCRQWPGTFQPSDHATWQVWCSRSRQFRTNLKWNNVLPSKLKNLRKLPKKESSRLSNPMGPFKKTTWRDMHLRTRKSFKCKIIFLLSRLLAFSKAPFKPQSGSFPL